MNALNQALEKWSQILGAAQVITDGQRLAAAENTTFATAQKIPAILRPANTGEVQECLRVAHRFQVPIYPVSQGKNWGLGSRVPPRDNCVLLELNRLNRIVEFDETLAYLTVEPGVTFRQATDHLRNQGTSLFLSVIGGHPDASLIGNALERGDGVGPYGERISHSCALEVVLPNGDCIHTGFDRFGESKVGRISRWGVGPYLDGLFSQSNLGIVTRMTFWLMPRPRVFLPFLMTIKDDRRLETVVERVRGLQARGIIRPSSIIFWNSHKMIASEQQYPWELTGGRTPLALGDMQKLRSPWKDCEWMGVGALYSAGAAQARADQGLIKKALVGETQKLIFFDRTRRTLIHWFQHPLRWFTGMDLSEVLKTLYDESVFLGFPTERSTKSTYWRKSTPLPAEMDPDRDRCGVIWLCPVVPFEGRHILRAVAIVNETAQRFKFEPQIAFITPSERAVYLFPSIVYDRLIAGEDERAMACHDRMLEAMIREGFYPYRLGVQSMKALSNQANGYDGVVGRIKDLLDPGHILAPGRYEFQDRGAQWPPPKTNQGIRSPG